MPEYVIAASVFSSLREVGPATLYPRPDPVTVQFGRFVANAARFDFGISYQVKQPVTAIIAYDLKF